MTAVSLRVLAALGRLNAHARDPGAGAARYAIYAYKEAATWMLLRAGEAAVRPVLWRGPCGKCDGSGTFTFWDGGAAPCRGCGATGTTELRFAEVALPDGQKWHHPWSTPLGGFCGYSMLQFALKKPGDGDGWNQSIDWECPFGWAPRQDGAPIEGDAFVETINRVETWILDPGPVDPDDRWKFESARRRMIEYCLKVTYRIPERCFRCGRADDLSSLRLGASGVWPLAWSARVCNEHEAEWKEGSKRAEADRWPRELPPEAMTPAIALWVSRRPEKRPRDPFNEDW